MTPSLSFRRAQTGAIAVETAFLLPVILIGLMMLFEIARLALVITLGHLALESSLQSLRTRDDVSTLSPQMVSDRVREGMVRGAHGYIESENIQVDVTSYIDLAAFGASVAGDGGADDEEDDAPDRASGPPVFSIEVALRRNWISALPALLGLPGSFTYTYHQVLGNIAVSPAAETGEAP